jgi:hypothetical protein
MRRRIELDPQGVGTHRGGKESRFHVETSLDSGKKYFIKKLTVDKRGGPKWCWEDEPETFENSAGFNEYTKQRLDRHYENLVRQYGDFIVKQRTRPRRSNPNRYEIEQEYTELADPPDIFAYDSQSLTPEIKKALARLLEIIKDSYASFLKLDRKTGTFEDENVMEVNEVDNEKNPALDLYGKNNLVITKSGEVKYLDTGLAITGYNSLFFCHNPGSKIQQTVARIAALECVLGRDPKKIMEEPIYKRLKKYCNEEGHDFSYDDLLSSPERCKEILLNLEKIARRDPFNDPFTDL